MTELGQFTPQRTPRESLYAGQVGYLVGNIKSLDVVHIGDTISVTGEGAGEPLAGYKEPQRMVYCGLYPADGQDFEELREALTKLSINDPSFEFEPETSDALGFGFRCGFLGLLHMEIIQQRPIVQVNFVLPTEYIGPVMQLSIERRGIHIRTEYLSPTRAMLTFDLPLAEVIYDLHDKLKSATRGFGTMNYELKGYEPADLVRMDILVNNNRVDALSVICDRGDAQRRGKAVVKKLKEEIERHMFEVAIQAAIGTRVISRETKPALRKNVTAKCYGGDITRKRKLWAKQKEGKKRMKSIGQVDIPQKAFLAVLDTGGEK